MTSVNMHEAKTCLSQLVEAGEKKGETVIICRDRTPVAQLIKYRAVVDRLTLDPSLRVTLHYDPVEPLAADEVPEEYR
jgi:antitoxin (DNA-binding transcriptional repressor) of toxin-antitoxin stability system